MDRKELEKRYLDTFKTLEKEVSRVESYGYSNPKYRDTALYLAWASFKRAAKGWSDYVVDHLAIPASKAKGIEMAVRLFGVSHGRGKGPRSGIIPWYKKNVKRFAALLLAMKWPERGEDDHLKVGPFTIHNTIGASDKHLRDVEAVFTKAIKLLPKVGLPQYRQVLYGDVFLVGQIERKNWAAWYSPRKDVIYFRPNIRGQSMDDKSATLIHELCHRYWRKNVSAAQKRAWTDYYVSIGRSSVHVEMPDEGVPIEGLTVNRKTPVVERYEPGRVFLSDAKTGKPLGSVKRSVFYSWLDDVARSDAYPTIYSRTNAEEFFCEAAKEKAYGRLSDKHLQRFNEIFT